ncbi:glutamate-5-semialdehyde dehydrogenase [Oscillospiraceae bacterium 42-9]
MTALEKQGAAAQAAARVLALASTAQKNQALEAIAQALSAQEDALLQANAADLAAAQAAGTRPALLDRLALNPERVASMAQGVRQVAALPDPTATDGRSFTQPNGLRISRRRVPLGVVGMIYEARPNVTVDAAALCLKSGNACILRGGKEAFRSNQAAVELMRGALEAAGLPQDCVSLVQDTSRDSAQELMHLDQYLDVLIPRGGAGLIRAVAKEASVPVIRTGEGVCHVYVDSSADLDMAARILYNAKCSRPSVCNAAECVVVHREAAEGFFQKALPLLDQNQVELRADPEALALLGSRAHPALEEDWDREYGDYILAVKTAASFEEAVAFINAHSSGHSECIVTESYRNAQAFLDQIDAAAVYVNASTRFTDGGQFGLGAEIGISTQKMHARGPMGLEELTSWKYVVYGSGQVRE